MAHFAQLDENNVVINVVVVDDNEIVDDADPDGTSETKGIAFLKSIEGEDTIWVQTSYNTNAHEHPENRPFRRTFAGVGMVYNSTLDMFVSPQPSSAWVLQSNGSWVPPVARPDDGGKYMWDEDAQEWTARTPPDSPFPSWTWNAALWQWEPPAAVPEDWDDNNPYEWNEDTLSWVEVE
jgi:hypothetical protein